MKRASTHTTRTQQSSGRANLRPDTRNSASSRRKRPPRVALVVACSQRKRLVPRAELHLRSINESLGARSIEWRRRIRSVEAAEYPAHDLYLGDHWRAACDAYKLALRYSSRAELWVMSAGYGLIPGWKSLKSYGATFANGSADSIWRGSADGDRQDHVRAWWQSLPHEETLSGLLKGGGAIMIAAGATYLDVLSVDLTTALERDLSGDRISVVSAGSRHAGALLPVTGRFRAAVGGTDASINARVLGLLAAEAPTHHFRHSAMSAILNRLASRVPAIDRRTGEPKSDDQVVDWINDMHRRKPTISRTQALREFRGANLACEQSRFASLWIQATS
jgi:hypothetical protein